MDAYKLKKEIPGLPAGTVFVHDPYDQVKGSIGAGCLKNAWKSGDCQGGWCAGTHVFPGQLAEDSEWFEKIDNNPMYYCD